MPSSQVYGTVDQLRMRIERTRNTDDTWLLQLLTAASRNIDRACNRADGFVTTTASARTYAGSGTAVQPIDECTSVTLVAVKTTQDATTYTAWATTDWVLFRGALQNPNFNEPPFDKLACAAGGNYSHFLSGFSGGAGLDPWFLSSAAASRLTYNPRSAHAIPTVQVTAKWGYADTLPADIREACLMQAARWYKRLQASMSDTLAGEGIGTLLYTQALDPDIKRLLVDGRYVKPAVG